MDFEVKVARDDEHAVWYVRESTIPGLRAEAPTYDALVEIIREIAPVLALENCPRPRSNASGAFRCGSNTSSI